MDKQDLKIRLEEIEQELKRNRFGLERYLAQCKRWQKELEDLEGGGFFSFLVNTESKKREAHQMLSDCKKDLEGAVSKVSSLEAEEKAVREELANLSTSDDSPDGDSSDGDSSDPTDPSGSSGDIGEFNEEIENEALALLEKIEKVIEVSNQSILDAHSQLASARLRSMSSGRPGKGRTRSVPMPKSDASGANIQMALDCLEAPVEKLCQLLNPVVASLAESGGSTSEESNKIIREKLLDLNNLARGLKTPDAYLLSGLSPIDLADEAKTTEISTSLIEMATNVSLIQGFLKK